VAKKGVNPEAPIFTLDQLPLFAKIMPMPRCSFSFTVLFSVFLLVTGCERSRSDSSTGYHEPLATNGPALTVALRSRDSEARVAAAQLIAVNTVDVDSADLIRALDDSNPNVRRHCAMALGRRRVAMAVRPLFPLLKDDNWFVRAEAAAALGRIGDPRAAGWLLQLLNDSDPYVRLCAGSALREVTTESHRALLLQAFAHANPLTLPDIAIALAKLGEPVALESLISATQTNDVIFRRRVTAALGDYTTPAVTNTLTLLLADPNAGVREEAARALDRVKSKIGDLPAKVSL